MEETNKINYIGTNDSLDIPAYIENAASTMNHITRPMTMAELDFIHMALGVGTEAGEIADIAKRMLAYDKPIDDVHLQEEIGDVMWYILLICKLRGYNFAKILEANNTKLLKYRYKNGFSNEAALNRDTDTERTGLDADLIDDIRAHYLKLIDNIEEPYRSEAIHLIKTTDRIFADKATDTATAISTWFSWGETPQGFAYWEKFHTKLLKKGESNGS